MTIIWICPRCGTENTEFDNPYPVIAECEGCGYADDNYREFGIETA